MSRYCKTFVCTVAIIHCINLLDAKKKFIILKLLLKFYLKCLNDISLLFWHFMNKLTVLAWVMFPYTLGCQNDKLLNIKEIFQVILNLFPIWMWILFYLTPTNCPYYNFSSLWSFVNIQLKMFQSLKKIPCTKNLQ